MLPFLRKVMEVYTPDMVLHLGDEVDNHKLSFHDSDEDLPFSASSELAICIEQMKGLYEVFGGVPVKVCESNHGSLLYRKAKHHGIPRDMLRKWEDILEAPDNWEWGFRWVIQTGENKTLFQHSIKANSLAASKHKSMNTAQGHYHSKCDIQWWSNDTGGLFFGATFGCLVDGDSMGMAYGKLFVDRPILGCGVIIDGIPLFIPMILDEEGRWIGQIA